MLNQYFKTVRWHQIGVLTVLLVGAFGVGLAQQEGTTRSLVARVSLLAGEVSYQRASDSVNDWFDATINLPLEESDQLYSGPSGRVELELGGRNLVRIAAESNLRFTRFSVRQFQLALPVGTATFRVETLDRRQFEVVDLEALNNDQPLEFEPLEFEPLEFEIDTPVAAITLLKTGIYRINVAADGTTELIVRRGEAEVYQGEIGKITVREGRRVRIQANDQELSVVKLSDDEDEWDRWNARRNDDLDRVRNENGSRYVPNVLPGARDLDQYGDWIETPEYGWVWSPVAVPADWAPYRLGYWRWYGTYGWTWISHEPWGWIPYHYGRWAWHRQHWYWVPNRAIQFSRRPLPVWRWTPHFVAFFGWGAGGYSNGYRDGFRDGYWTGYQNGRGWMGWCPLAPGEDRDDRRQSRDLSGKDANEGRFPGSVEKLRNYQAPGGVSGVESRRFIENRVVLINGQVSAPPRNNPAQINPARNNPRGVDPGSGFVKDWDVKPNLPVVPTRTILVERSDIRRRLESSTPVVVRRQPTSVGGGDGGGQPGSPDRPVRNSTGDAQHSPVRPPVVPPRSSGARIIDGQVVQPERAPGTTPQRQDGQDVKVGRPSYPVPTRPVPPPINDRGNDSRLQPVPRREVPYPPTVTSPAPPRRQTPPSIPPSPPREIAPPRRIERPVERPAAPVRETPPPAPVPARPSAPPPARPAERPERPVRPTRESPPPSAWNSSTSPTVFFDQIRIFPQWPISARSIRAISEDCQTKIEMSPILPK